MGCSECSCAHYSRLSGSIFNHTHEYPLMVIGESPTVAETRQGHVMSGPGAQVLMDTLIKVGLPSSTQEVYYTTAIKCAVPKKKGSKMPKDAPINCRNYLLAEIRAIKPRMVLVCGSVAWATLNGSDSFKITEMYGRIKEFPAFPGVQFMAIMNPGVLLHKPGDFKPFLSMLTLAATIYNGGAVQAAGETKWIVCDTRDKCYALFKLMQSKYADGTLKWASYDIEATGLDYRVVDFLVMGICFEKGLTYVIPREMMAALHNFLEGIPWKCIWQNGKFDKKLMWSRKLGNVRIDEDTEYLHYVLDETTEHNLGYLAKTFLNAEEYKYKMNQNWKAVTLETYDVFYDALCERVAVDCNYTYQLCEVFHETLAKADNSGLLNLYNTMLIPAANFLTRVEQNGILINSKYLGTMDVQYRILLDKILEEIKALAEPFWNREIFIKQTGAKSAPINFNPGSPAQMSWMVFDRLKIRPRIKKGRSTDKDILKSITDPPALITKVLEYRTVQKEHSTYVLGLLEAQDKDGRVRTSFTLHVTATGRLSSKEPNVQNQPSANGVGNIRKAFVAAPGYVLAEIDYSGAELRWLAYLSKCPVLGEVFIQGRNLHVETATTLFGADFTKKQKMRAKAVNFGIPYGREAKSLAQEFDISVEEAQEMLDGWLNKYYGAKEYLEWCASQVLLGKYLETPFGRRRRFGLVSPASLHALQNEAKNFPIQSSSSDLLLYCAMKMEPQMIALGVRMINLVHDSILFEIPDDPAIVKRVGQIANRIMVEAPIALFDCPIPFKTDFEVGYNWGEMGGNEFDYDEEADGLVMKIEGAHDEITEMTYINWRIMRHEEAS
jgi:DNA polymerase-1